MIIIASLFFFFSENPLNPDFASSIPYGPYTPAQSPVSCSKVCLRHKTLLYSIVRLFQSLFPKNLVIFFSIADKIDDTFALLEVQTKNIEFAESFTVPCRCVKEAQEGGGRVKGVRVESTPIHKWNRRERERVFPERSCVAREFSQL